MNTCDKGLITPLHLFKRNITTPKIQSSFPISKGIRII